MVLIHDRIIIIDICNFEMSYKTPEKSLKSNQIYSVTRVTLDAYHTVTMPTARILHTMLSYIYIHSQL